MSTKDEKSIEFGDKINLFQIKKKRGKNMINKDNDKPVIGGTTDNNLIKRFSKKIYTNSVLDSPKANSQRLSDEKLSDEKLSDDRLNATQSRFNSADNCGGRQEKRNYSANCGTRKSRNKRNTEDYHLDI